MANTELRKEKRQESNVHACRRAAAPHAAAAVDIMPLCHRPRLEALAWKKIATLCKRKYHAT